jgi:hypothetical protein
VRALTLAALTGLVLAGAASAFSPAKTTACLKAGGARIVSSSSFHYPEIQRAFLWQLGTRSGLPTGETVFFTRGATDTARLESRLVHLVESSGWTRARARHAVGHSGNVVWFDQANLRPLSRGNLSLLRRCLR